MSNTSHAKLPLHIPFRFHEVAGRVRNIDMLWFRWLSVATSLGGIAYKVLYPHETPLQLVLLWNVAFIGFNLVHIAILLNDRKPVDFSEDERELYDTVFHLFSPVEFMKLMRIGKWLTAEEGALLAEEGKPLSHLMLVYNGTAAVESRGEIVAHLRDGSFIGEMSLVTQNPASATVRTAAPTRYIQWPKDELQRLLERNPNMRNAMHSVVATDLTKKLLTR